MRASSSTAGSFAHLAWLPVLVLVTACGGSQTTRVPSHARKLAADGGAPVSIVDGRVISDAGAPTPVDGSMPADDADSGTELPPLAQSLTLKNYMFVTSTTQAADFGGLAGADQLCNERALAASLPGSYVAWLSTVDVDARDRIPAAVSGWVRPDRRPFAVSRAALVSGAVLYPARLDELGSDLVSDTTPIITATEANGTYYREGSYTDCVGFRSSSMDSICRTGTVLGGTYQWTAADGATCAQLGRILCLGIDDALSVEVVPSTGRLAFLSRNTFVPGGGLSAADDLCANEARAAALSGSFVALLAAEGASAVSRLSAGAPWVRADGVAIVDHASDLLGGQPMLAPITLQLDGTYRGTVGVWTGAETPDALPSPALHCSAFTSSSGDGLYGISGWSGAPGFDFDRLPCTASYLHVYCFER